MTTAKIYEDAGNEMVAIVFEDGECVNYIPCPEMAALDADSFLEEARYGFPDAPLYEYDSMVGLTLEKAAARAERECTLIAQVGSTAVLYPSRMSEDTQDFFRCELGDELWEAVLRHASGSGVEFEF